MNHNNWTSPRIRLGCFAAATLFSTVVIGSVVWLFAAGAPTAASAPYEVAMHAPADQTARAR